jgi:hypothetical protein
MRFAVGGWGMLFGGFIASPVPTSTSFPHVMGPKLVVSADLFGHVCIAATSWAVGVPCRKRSSASKETLPSRGHQMPWPMIPKRWRASRDFDALVIATLLVLTSRAGNCP